MCFLGVLSKLHSSIIIRAVRTSLQMFNESHNLWHSEGKDLLTNFYIKINFSRVTNFLLRNSFFQKIAAWNFCFVFSNTNSGNILICKVLVVRNFWNAHFLPNILSWAPTPRWNYWRLEIVEETTHLRMFPWLWKHLATFLSEIYNLGVYNSLIQC